MAIPFDMPRGGGGGGGGQGEWLELLLRLEVMQGTADTSLVENVEGVIDPGGRAVMP